MTPPKFTLLTQSLGIWLSRVSITNALALAEIAKEPAPMMQRTSRAKNKTAPVQSSAALSVGPLITHGLVELRRHDAGGDYCITPKGSDYLALLRHHNLLPS